MYWLVRKNKDGSVNILDTEDFVIDTLTMSELAYYLDKGVEVIGARRNMFMGGQIITVVKKLYCLCDIGHTYASLVSLDGTEKKTIIFSGKNCDKIEKEEDIDLIEGLINDGVLVNYWDDISGFTKDLFLGKEVVLKRSDGLSLGTEYKYFQVDVSINRKRYKMYTTDEYKVRSVYRSLLSYCDIMKLGKEELDYSRYNILENEHTEYSVNVYDSVNDEVVRFKPDDVRAEIINGYGFRGLSFDNIGFFKYDCFYDNIMHEIRGRKKEKANNKNNDLRNIVASSDNKVREETRYTYNGIFRNESINYYDNDNEVDMQMAISNDERLVEILTIENFGSSLPIILDDLKETIKRLEVKGKLSGKDFSTRIYDMSELIDRVTGNNISSFEYSNETNYIYFNDWQYKHNINNIVALKNGKKYSVDSLSNVDMNISIISNKHTFTIGMTNDSMELLGKEIGVLKADLHLGVKRCRDNRGLPVDAKNSMSSYFIKYDEMPIGKRYGIPIPEAESTDKFTSPLHYISLIARYFEDFGSMPLAVVGVEITGFKIRLIQLCIEMSVSWVRVCEDKKVPLIKECSIYLDYVDKNKVLTVDTIKDEVNYVLVEIGQSSLTIPKVIWEAS